MKFNNRDYQEIRLLGKGKSGYSYLVKDENANLYVLKKIHHEKCDYYNFGDKLEVEINDYNILKSIVLMPKLIDVDYEKEIILKEYIDGKNIKELIDENVDIKIYTEQIRKIADICKANNLNIDYYPSNFIPVNNKLYYVDYECNIYDNKWSFDNWGINYWNASK